MENLLTAGLFTTQRMPELKLYIKTLDDDSVMPKQKLQDLVDVWEQEQRKIAAIEARSQAMLQRANSFLMAGPQAKSQQLAESQNKARLLQLIQSAQAQRQQPMEEAAAQATE